MSLYVDQAYIGMMSTRLPLFRQIKSTLFNFRCPICGDSTKNPYKRRAYFYIPKSGDSFAFQCHNCSASHSLYTFISLLFPEMLNGYRLEKFTDKRTANVLEEAIPFKKLEVVSDDVVPVDELPENHPAIVYLRDERKLPESVMGNFFHVQKYVEWLKKTTQDNELTYREHARILIPYINKNGQIYRYVARSYDCNVAAKYLYTDLDMGSSYYNFYGIDPSKKVYIVEGQIDSMLLPNSIAIGNAKYSRGEFDQFSDYVIIPDNECRNRQIVESVEKAVNAGMNVCIWPRYLGKDINDMLKNGISLSEIVKIIDDSTFSGIKAKLKLKEWRKI